MSNYIFLDGHAKAMKPSSTVRPGPYVNNESNLWIPSLADRWFGSDPTAVQDTYRAKLQQAENNQR